MIVVYILSNVLVWSLVYFYIGRKKGQRIFKDMGIPGPSPNVLFESMNHLYIHMMPIKWKILKGFHDIYQIWTKKYGNLFGYFEGPTPILVTSDPDIIQQVFVKQFHNFHARKVWPVQVDPEEDEDVHVFFAMGKRWRRLRSAVSPAFSSQKMRIMSTTICKVLKRFTSQISQKTNKVQNYMTLFQGLTFDSIVCCVFGLESHAIVDETDPFLTHSRQVIDDTTKQPLLYLLGFMFPTMHYVWIRIYTILHYIKKNPVFWLEEKIGTIYNARDPHKKQDHVDILQVLSQRRIKQDVNQVENSVTGSDGKSMTEKEIIQHALLYLLAGYETTSTTLTYAFHEITTNTGIQDKLREEIRHHYPTEEDKPSYENVRNLKYLDMVIKETLRKYPLASVIIARKCMKTCVVMGITIPKGMVVQADVWSLHRRSDIWGDGDLEIFNPERFSADHSSALHPYAWIPFGAGPRMCQGSRFAVLQIKLVLISLLRKYNFTSCSAPTLELIEGATIIPKYGIHLSSEPIQ